MGVTFFFVGLLVFIIYKVLINGFFVVRPDQRAVIVSFGRARRATAADSDINLLSEEEHSRYNYPAVEVVKPGGPYFKWPWQQVRKVSVATETANVTWDPTKAQSTIEAVTKDNLTTGVNGQLRFRVSEENLYAYLFGVERPLEHVMGYFVSVLRERISTFVDPRGGSLLEDGEIQSEEASSAVDLSEGVSINDLRKNLPLLNSYMEQQCHDTKLRYGIELDAALITEIDPPPEVDRALSAINSTRNEVAADVSTARADSEQQITMSKRAVEIATNNAQAEVAPLIEIANTLNQIKAKGGQRAVDAYLRNMRTPLFSRARSLLTKSRGGVLRGVAEKGGQSDA